MPPLQWNPFGAASSDDDDDVNDNCGASCGRIGCTSIVDDFTNALNDIALPFASQSREGSLFGLSKYLLKWQQLNAYEMVITHTPHCAAEGSAATYCRSFILLIAPVGERHWARFIKQLNRKSSQLSWAQLTFAVLVARLNWRCRCVCHFYNKLWPIELSLAREKEERKPTVWQFLASLDGIIVAGISCVHFWRSRERERATPADAQLRLIAFLALNQLSSNKSPSQGARL